MSEKEGKQDNQPDQNLDPAVTEVIEKQARALGWVPKEEFRGNPEIWKDAVEFVRHGEETLPILRENLKKLHAKLDEQGRVIKNFAEHHKKTEERAYKRALKTLQEERLKAVDKGDTEKFEEIDKEIQDLEKTYSESEKEKTPAFSSWAEENPWYGDDIDMSMYADYVGNYLANKHPDWGPDRVFKEVTKKVKNKFPDKFTNPRRDQAPPVEGGGTAPAGTAPSGKKYSDLPPEAKKICDEFVAQKLLTREQYVKDYFTEA